MKEELLKIFSDYLEDADYLKEEQQLMLMQMGMESERLLSFWYSCFECMNRLIEKAEVTEMQLSFYMDEKCHLLRGKQEIVLEQENARELIARFIDIFEPIHPLGTVVALSEDFSKSLKLKNQKDKVKVVIIERFASTKDKETYFPYIGIVYPVGMLGRGKCIHFTSALIDSVVQEGFRDEMEDAYVLLMKKELILDNDAMSFGFLERDRMEQYRDELEA